MARRGNKGVRELAGGRWPIVAGVAAAVGIVLLLVVGFVGDRSAGISEADAQRYAAEDAAASSSAAATASAAAPPLAELRADGDLSIYWMGDSLTDGYNASTQDQGFRPTVEAALGVDGPVTGTADYKAGARLREVMDLATLPTQTDVAVIELGTNNVSAEAESEVPGFRNDYSDLVSTLAPASGRLVCLGVFRGGRVADLVDNQIRQLCGDAGGAFISLQDVYADKALVAADGTPGYPKEGDGGHPNDAGHAEIAQRIENALVNTP